MHVHIYVCVVNVCMSVCLCVFLSVDIQVCVCVCGDQKSASDVASQVPFRLFLEIGSLTSLELVK